MALRLALVFVLSMAAAACKSDAPPAATPAADPAPAPADEATAPAADELPGGNDEAAAPAADGAVADDTFEDGTYTSPRFNVRFEVPDGWSLEQSGSEGLAGLGTSDDSITFVGPSDGLRLVVANTDSLQLVDASFANLTETIGFENVRIVPDSSQMRTFNGIPGYRTEADAHLRGEAVPQYIIAQALELPGKPTMFTIFVNGDMYDVHVEAMRGILNSVEALSLRGN